MTRSFDNIEAVLKAAGMAPSQVDQERLNAVYTKFFQDPRPTRKTVVVAKLVGPGNIEITATARKH